MVIYYVVDDSLPSQGELKKLYKIISLKIKLQKNTIIVSNQNHIKMQVDFKGIDIDEEFITTPVEKGKEKEKSNEKRMNLIKMQNDLPKESEKNITRKKKCQR